MPIRFRQIVALWILRKCVQWGRGAGRGNTWATRRLELMKCALDYMEENLERCNFIKNIISRLLF